MTKRRGDPTPTPPGGRSAERLREFERARGLDLDQPKKGTKPTPGGSDESRDESPPEGEARPDEKPKHESSGSV